MVLPRETSVDLSTCRFLSVVQGTGGVRDYLTSYRFPLSVRKFFYRHDQSNTTKNYSAITRVEME